MAERVEGEFVRADSGPDDEHGRRGSVAASSNDNIVQYKSDGL